MMRDPRPVLPKLPKSQLRSIDDLLTPEEREALHADLARMAKQRRDAEAASACIVVGGS